eukprot:3327124-Pleurochrysis_carterae.AAC.1
MHATRAAMHEQRPCGDAAWTSERRLLRDGRASLNSTGNHGADERLPTAAVRKHFALRRCAPLWAHRPPSALITQPSCAVAHVASSPSPRRMLRTLLPAALLPGPVKARAAAVSSNPRSASRWGEGQGAALTSSASASSEALLNVALPRCLQPHQSKGVSHTVSREAPERRHDATQQARR